MQKKNFFSFHFRVHITSPSLMARLRKTREMQKKNFFSFHFRVHITSPSLMARLRKKLVTKEQFWKMNAFQPKIKAIRGKTRKLNFGLKANLGGLRK